jgi:ligand-binding sensor domain-containing protein
VGLKKKILISLLFYLLLKTINTDAQNLSFHHLNTSHGLSNNTVNAATVDKNGLLWVGTTDGLNIYDGYAVQSFFKEKHIGLASNGITHLLCDSSNRIWVGTNEGVTMIDDNRQFHKIKLDTLESFITKGFLQTKSDGIVVFAGNGSYKLDEKTQHWNKIDWLNNAFKNQGIREIISFKDDRYFVIEVNRIFYIDFVNKKLLDTFNISRVRTGTVLNDEELLLGDFESHLFYYNFKQKKITRKYQLTYRGNQGSLISENIFRIRKTTDNQVLVTTANKGIFILDPVTDKRTYYIHEPFNPFSLSADYISDIHCATNGYVILMTQTTGLDILNIKNSSAGYYKLLPDKKGELYDNVINGMAEDKEGNIWMGSDNKLIEWNRFNNSFNFLAYPYTNPRLSPTIRFVSVGNMCFDKEGRLLLASPGAGIGIFDTKRKIFRQLNRDTVTDKGTSLRTNFIHDLQLAADGSIWGGSNGGIFQINTDNFSIQSYYQHPLLKQLDNVRCYKLFFDKAGRLWIGTTSLGIWLYDEKKQTLKHYDRQSGIIPYSVYAFAEDDAGNIYAGTEYGFYILYADGRIKTYNRTSKLPGKRCTGILKDSHGNFWMANDKTIFRYSPADSSFEYFDEKNGISNDGFLPFGFFKTSDEMMIWGSNKGFNYFYPDKMKRNNIPFQLIVQQLKNEDSTYQFTKTNEILFPYNRNSIEFFYTSVDLSGSSKINYRYMLEGLDKNWSSSTSTRQVRYNSLAPGNYRFLVQASENGIDWIQSSNVISITINPPFWKTWWFRSLSVLLITGLIYFIFKSRMNYIRRQQAEKIVTLQKEQAIAEKELLLSHLNHDLAVTKLTALRVQMNPHFIFNALNSIQQMVLRGEDGAATKYLSRFSKLLRLVLQQSDRTTVTLNEELEILYLYLELEALRYTDSFEYAVTVDRMIDKDDTEIPTLLIQPFVENAIWHGLLHKQGKRKLGVHFGLNNNEELVCTIDDNGIGREAAAKIFENEIEDNQHTGKGIKAAEERLHLFNQQHSAESRLDIIDKKDEIGNAAGTTIIVTLPEIN